MRACIIYASAYKRVKRFFHKFIIATLPVRSACFKPEKTSPHSSKKKRFPSRRDIRLHIMNYQQICFIKADGNSDEDIIFNCNNLTGSKLPLNMSGELEPNNTLDFSILFIFLIQI